MVGLENGEKTEPVGHGELQEVSAMAHIYTRTRANGFVGFRRLWIRFIKSMRIKSILCSLYRNQCIVKFRSL